MSVAELARRSPPDGEFEEIDLDALTFAELLLEQATVKAELVKIEAQLADPTRIEKLGAREYRIWRRNALLAHSHFNRERLDIHALLQIKGPEASQARQVKRQEAGIKHNERLIREAAERRERRQADWASLTAEEQAARLASRTERAAARSAAHAAMMDQHRQQRAAIVTVLQESGSVDSLVLRLALVIRHLVGDGNLPDTVPQEDRTTLHEMSVYLSSKFGRAAVKAILRGEGVAP